MVQQISNVFHLANTGWVMHSELGLECSSSFDPGDHSLTCEGAVRPKPFGCLE